MAAGDSPPMGGEAALLTASNLPKVQYPAPAESRRGSIRGDRAGRPPCVQRFSRLRAALPTSVAHVVGSTGGLRRRFRRLDADHASQRLVSQFPGAAIVSRVIYFWTSAIPAPERRFCAGCGARRLSVFGERGQQHGDQTRPASLVAGADAAAGVAVEILVELQVVAEVRVGLQSWLSPKIGRRPVASRRNRRVSRRVSSSATSSMLMRCPDPGRAFDLEVVAVVMVELAAATR